MKRLNNICFDFLINGVFYSTKINNNAGNIFGAVSNKGFAKSFDVTIKFNKPNLTIPVK